MTRLVGGDVKGTAGIDQRDRFIFARMKVEKPESFFSPAVESVCIHASTGIDANGRSCSPLPMEIIANLVSLQSTLVHGQNLADYREGVD